MYKVIFGGETFYDGSDKDAAKTIATAFAHAYNVQGWSGASLKMSVELGALGTRSMTGYLGRDAITTVDKFFSSY